MPPSLRNSVIYRQLSLTALRTVEESASAEIQVYMKFTFLFIKRYLLNIDRLLYSQSNPK